MEDYDVNEEAIVDTLKMCESRPHQAIELLKDEEDNYFWVLGRFIAYSMLAIKPFVEAEVPPSSTGAEFFEAARENTVDLCKSAINELLKIEQGSFDISSSERNQFKECKPQSEKDKNTKYADGICVILNRIRPGRVQELRGITKISFFSEFISKSNELQQKPRYLSDEESHIINDIPFEMPEIVRSGLAFKYGEKLNGAKTVSFKMFSKTNGAKPPYNKDEIIGILTLGSDGSYLV